MDVWTRYPSLALWLAIGVLAFGCSGGGSVTDPDAGLDSGTDDSDGACPACQDGGEGTDGGSVGDSGRRDAADMADTSVSPTCVPVDGPDRPDDDGLDTNCDGIDGMVASSVFVSPRGNDDAAGSPGDPVGSIGRALEVAEAEGKTAILVAQGTYHESIELVSGVSIYGGYSGSDWQRTPRPTGRAVIRGASPVVRGTQVFGAVTLAWLEIEALDATEPGGSSIGISLSRANGVRLMDSVVRAGRGAKGLDGTRPRAASDGPTGNDGDDAVRYTDLSQPRPEPPARTPIVWSPCSSSNFGGYGGVGGDYAYAGGRETTARPGGSALGDDDGPVVGGAAGAVFCMPGERGHDGRPGALGEHGSAQQGTFDDVGYLPADGGEGLAGADGTGGGGGGGGRGSVGELGAFTSGASGGSGGAGGGGGSGGEGGQGGGASIAAYLVDSSPTFVRVSLWSSDGGAGGQGAPGGLGGQGGRGGQGGQPATDLTNPTYACNGAGGAGGAGGDGGQGGGGGGGGGGGPSIGLVLFGDSQLGQSSASVAVTIGQGGAGGAGGPWPDGTRAEEGSVGLATPQLSIED